jgi:hypothetical protein
MDRGGPLLLGLTFRVGWADEELHRHGLTHLVEHLALHDAATARLPVNGFVDATKTHFVLRGTTTEASQFIDSVCRSLRQLPLDRIETEARVLRTEGAGRSGSAYDALLANRFGAEGYGLAAYPELGLVEPRADEVQEWCNRWFTAENAVMWSTCDPPDDLALDLATGSRRPPPHPQPLPWSLPSWYRDQTRCVALSFLVDRTDAATLAARLLERRTHDRLRLSEGHSYQVTGALETWTPQHAHGVLVADALPEHADEVRSGLMAEVGKLATTLPKPHELDDLIADAARHWTDADAAGQLASNQASNELIGHRVRGVDAFLEELRAVSPEDTRSAASAFLDGALLQLPMSVDLPDRRFSIVPSGSVAVAQGREFTRSRRLGEESDRQTLVVGPAGVSLVHTDDLRLTVYWSDLVAMQRWSDEARTCWGRDGLRVFVHAGEWMDGSAAVALIDAAARGDLTIDMRQEAGSRYLDEASRQESQKSSSGLLRRLRGR